VDYDFTARAEAQFDEVARGNVTWQEMLREFYQKFHPLIEASAKADRAEASQARELGKDPATGKPIIARFGRYGPMLQLGEAGDTKDKSVPKPRFAPLPEGTTLETVTLEKALPMFSLPREVGKTEDGQEIVADIGRFGPYVRVGTTFVSIKGMDPLTITEAEAREAYKQKNEAAQKKTIADFGEIKVLQGPYGPYVTDGKKNARIPKSKDPKKITEAQAKEMIAAAPAKGRRRRK
jgi:DNA topoisomerase-1